MNCIIHPATPTEAPTATSMSLVGWNGGAESEAVLTGNVHAVFTVPLGVSGVICGFAPPGARLLPESITHGWYFWTQAAQTWVVAVERGVPVMTPWVPDISGGEAFELRRVGDTVTFVDVYGGTPYISGTSTRRSSGPLVLMACLYATGDSVG